MQSDEIMLEIVTEDEDDDEQQEAEESVLEIVAEDG